MPCSSTRGSGHQAFERAQEQGTLPVSITSAYDKLGNLPLPLSEALLDEGTQRLNAVLPETLAVDPLPDCWAGFEVFGADGKAIKHVQPAAQAVARLAGGHPRCAGVGGLEPADGPGRRDGRPSRRRSR